ncbi:MAG: EAL domain-containing protein [Betaproteobacteria bacterium]
MLIDAMPFSIAYADNDLCYQVINRRFEELLGRTRGEVVGKHICEVVGPVYFERVRPYLDQVMTGKEVKYELDDVDDEGHIHRVEALYLPHADRDGSVLGHFSIVQDVTERERNEALLQYLASHDQLTRLPNRNRFLEQLTAEIARAARYEYKIGVLFIDLDRFKNVNDTLGHDFGDSLLVAVAERFRATLREVDMVARLGGDEFTAILSEIKSPQEAAASAQRLLNSLKTPIVINGQEIFAGASIGISIFPDNGTDTKVLLRNADVAMYRAKEMGKNTFQFFSQGITASSVERLLLENHLRRAAERGEFILHYQPIVDIESLRIVGMESLIRWDRPDSGPVPPATFIPLAEESGLIVPIGDWVLETACRAAHALHQSGHAGLRVAVNLSPKQFRHRDLAQTIADTLARTGLAARHLELEITESSVMENPDAAVRTMHMLKEMGVHLSIDDFGTGYSSLSKLKHFPISTLKVDQSFVKDIPLDEDNAAIASAIIAMGQRLRLSLVAEGVETVEQLAFLRERGCQYAQGYLFSRPLPYERLSALLVTGLPKDFK